MNGITKTIVLNAVISSIRAKVDKSISFTVQTPELTPDEVGSFFLLQGINVDLSIKPLDEPEAPEIKINKDIEQKTKSQRLRNIIYVVWRNIETGRDFNTFYNDMMDEIAEDVKRRYLNNL
jgi:hypothetical protein